MPGIRDTVPLEPFQRRFEQLRVGGTTGAEIAQRLDWYTSAGAPDGPRLHRVLGLRSWSPSSGKKEVQSSVTLKTAKLLADAMDLDYHEVGL